LPRKDFQMAATTLPQLTQHSSDNQHSLRIFIGVGLVVGGIALVGILAEGGHYVGERNCQPRVELCAPADKLWLPDESEKNPSNPLGGLRIAATASSSTITPTNAVVPAISK
jgi:hypothetical protein